MKTRGNWFVASLVVCGVAFLSVRLLGVSSAEEAQLKLFKVSTLHGLKAVYPSVKLIMPPEG